MMTALALYIITILGLHCYFLSQAYKCDGVEYDPQVDGPFIYVYDIPSDLLDRQYLTRDWVEPLVERTNWHRIEQYMYLSLANYYPGRVNDSNKADYFYVPHTVSTVSRMNKNGLTNHLFNILQHIVHEYPHFNASNGMDHISAYGYDAWHNTVSPQNAQTFLSTVWNFMWILDQGDNRNYFNTKTNIITLPYTWNTKNVFPKEMANRVPWKKRQYIGLFRGTICEEDIPGYRGNALRQQLKYIFEDNSKFHIVASNQASAKQDRKIPVALEMLNSQFCFFLPGYNVWSERIGNILYSGCIPVVISDHYALPFWFDINWNDYLIRFRNDDLYNPGYIEKFLMNFPVEKAIRMEKNILNLLPSLTYNFPPQDGDIFDRFLCHYKRNIPRAKNPSWN